MIRQLRSHKQRPRSGRIEAIDAFDRELVKFVLNWAPYGPPPEDEVLPRFGITSDRLGQRICDIAAAGLTRNLRADDRVLLLRALALIDPATSQPRGSNVNPGHAPPSGGFIDVTSKGAPAEAISPASAASGQLGPDTATRQGWAGVGPS